MERSERDSRDARIMSSRQRGYSHAAIASQHGLSERQVQRVVKQRTEANRKAAAELTRSMPSERTETGINRAQQLLDQLEHHFRCAVLIANSWSKSVSEELPVMIAIKLFRKHKAELAEMLELIPEPDGRPDDAA